MKRLARGPAEGAAAEQMHMKVIDGLAAVAAGVNDETVAVIQALFPGEGAGLGKQGAEEGGVFRQRVGVGRNVALGDEQDVGRGLGVNVSESEDIGGFMQALDGDHARDDLAKKAVWGRRIGHVEYRTPALSGAF